MVVGLAALALLAAACGGDDGETSDSGTGTGTATTAAPGAGSTTAGSASTTAEASCRQGEGGTITIATGSPTTGLDPTQILGAASTGGMENTALYDTLLRYDPDTAGYEANLAESFEQTGDLEWTVHLRAGVTFADGSPLTAADLKATLDRMKAAKVSSAALANLIADVRVVDDRTAVYTLAKPWGEFPYFLAEENGMVTKVATAAAAGPQAFALDNRGAGAGPFVLQRFAPGEELVLSAREGWWGGDVCPAALRFTAPAGAQAALDALRSGEVDVAFMIDPKVARDARAAGMAVTEVVSGAGSVLLLNQGAHGAVSPTDALEVRQAVVAALDVELIDQRTYDGAGLPTSALTWDEQAIHPATPGPTFDPTAAKAHVAAAKAAGWDGHLDVLCGTTPDAVERGIVVQGLLEGVGMDVEVENVDSPTLFDRVANKGDYELACWGGNVPDGSPWATVLTQYASDAAANRVGLKDPRMDAALVRLREAGDIAARKAAMDEVQQAWNATVPAAVLNAQQWFIVARPEVQGLEMTRDAIPMFAHARVTG